MMITCIHIPAFPLRALHALGDSVHHAEVVVQSGRVVAMSRRAARGGIVEGITVERARTLMPELRVQVRDRTRESAAFEDLLMEVNRLTPYLAPDVHGRVYARQIEPGALAEFAARVGAQVGVAETRATALLAAMRAGPGHVMAVPARQVNAFLSRYPTSLLGSLSFEPDLYERLLLFGYRDLFQVASLSARHLTAQFGLEGTRLYELLHPSNEPRIGAWEPPPVLEARFDLEDPVTEPGLLDPLLMHLSEEIMSRAHRVRCGRIRVEVWSPGQEEPRSATRIPVEPAADAGALLTTVRLLLPRLLGAPVAALRIEAGALQSVRPQQGMLFRSRPDVYHAVRRVERRFPGALLRAVVVPCAVFQEEAVHFEPFPSVAPVRRKGVKP